MAYTATLAHHRGLLSDAEHTRLLTLFSRAGLTIDHPQFDEHVIDKGTAAILKTRDGKLRLAVPNPLGSCTFLNDVSQEELLLALKKHKEFAKSYQRQGAGLEAYVDSSDTGYTNQASENKSVMDTVAVNGDGLKQKVAAKVANGTNGHTNGHSNGHVNGHTNGHTNGHSNGNGVKEVQNSHVEKIAKTNGVH